MLNWPVASVVVVRSNPTDCVGEMNRRVGNDGAGGIGHGAVHGAGIAALRGRGERREDQHEEGKDA